MRHTEEAESDSWGTLVRRHRERHQLTQQQLADRVGMTRESIGRHESGKLRPSYETAVAIIRELGIDRDLGLRIAGYGHDAAPDPYAHVREMGLDPNGRVVRRILALDVDETFRMRLLRRERELQLRDEQQRLEDLEWNLADDARERREREAG